MPFDRMTDPAEKEDRRFIRPVRTGVKDLRDGYRPQRPQQEVPVETLAAEGLRLDLDVFDYLILAIYFATVLGGAEITKAQGVRINLWMGLAMLALGAFFLLWLRWRPTEVRAASDPADETGPQDPAGD
jgi:hypothetical protein